MNMGLLEKINNALRTALRAGDTTVVSTLRMVQAAIHNQEIAKRTKLVKEGKSFAELTDEEILDVLSSEVKKRREAIAEFEKGGRSDLVEAEKAELKIIQAYLPAGLSESEVQSLIREAIGEVGAKSPNEIGKVMAYLAPKLKSRADMALVRHLAQKTLGGP